MSELNLLFRNRIGIPHNETITFDNLSLVLEKTARTIPFENLCILKKQATEFTEEYILNKIIEQNQGGVCYELNYILYLFLLENGFQAQLIRGIIFNQMTQSWNTIGHTHVAILLTYKRQKYIIDTGFGGNLPLRPVPLSGEIVTSPNGSFRVEKVESNQGDHIFYMKLKDKDTEWKTGYAFDSKEELKNKVELEAVQEIITEHPESPFNKKPLITRLTDTGNITLTDSSLTIFDKGKFEKLELEPVRFKELAKEYFGIKSE